MPMTKPAMVPAFGRLLEGVCAGGAAGACPDFRGNGNRFPPIPKSVLDEAWSIRGQSASAKNVEFCELVSVRVISTAQFERGI